MYHNPVLLKQSVDGLVTDPDGIYVDCTFGGGGHSKEILSRLSDKGKLYAFDQDLDALKNNIDEIKKQIKKIIFFRTFLYCHTVVSSRVFLCGEIEISFQNNLP